MRKCDLHPGQRYSFRPGTRSSSVSSRDDFQVQLVQLAAAPQNGAPCVWVKLRSKAAEAVSRFGEQPFEVRCSELICGWDQHQQWTKDLRQQHQAVQARCSQLQGAVAQAGLGQPSSMLHQWWETGSRPARLIFDCKQLAWLLHASGRLDPEKQQRANKVLAHPEMRGAPALIDRVWREKEVFQLSSGWHQRFAGGKSQYLIAELEARALVRDAGLLGSRSIHAKVTAAQRIKYRLQLAV